MVNPFAVDLYLATDWTESCLLIHYFSFWLNPSDKEKHHPFLLSNSEELNLHLTCSAFRRSLDTLSNLYRLACCSQGRQPADALRSWGKK